MSSCCCLKNIYIGTSQLERGKRTNERRKEQDERKFMSSLSPLPLPLPFSLAPEDESEGDDGDDDDDDDVGSDTAAAAAAAAAAADSADLIVELRTATRSL